LGKQTSKIDTNHTVNSSIQLVYWSGWTSWTYATVTDTARQYAPNPAT